MFEKQDFELFTVNGLDARMDQLNKQLRPKFFRFGEELNRPLSSFVGCDMFPHVAKHARRKTNPPNDSWVAFSASPRGYKMLPHFQICVWNTHVLIQWGIIYESEHKTVFAEALLSNLDAIKKTIPAHFTWFKNHTKPEGMLHEQMTDADFVEVAKRLQHSKNGEIMIGLRITRDDALLLNKEDFYDVVLKTWKSLQPLHALI